MAARRCSAHDHQRALILNPSTNLADLWAVEEDEGSLPDLLDLFPCEIMIGLQGLGPSSSKCFIQFSIGLLITAAEKPSEVGDGLGTVVDPNIADSTSTLRPVFNTPLLSSDAASPTLSASFPRPIGRLCDNSVWNWEKSEGYCSMQDVERVPSMQIENDLGPDAPVNVCNPDAVGVPQGEIRRTCHTNTVGMAIVAVALLRPYDKAVWRRLTARSWTKPCMRSWKLRGCCRCCCCCCCFYRRERCQGLGYCHVAEVSDYRVYHIVKCSAMSHDCAIIVPCCPFPTPVPRLKQSYHSHPPNSYRHPFLRVKQRQPHGPP